MDIIVNITLSGNDSFASSPDEAAETVLSALNANPETDSCHVSVNSVQSGVAGKAANTQGEVPPE